MKNTLNTGTMDLRMLSQRYLTEGLMIAGLFHFAVIGGLQALMHYYNIDENIPQIIFKTPTDLLRFNFDRSSILPIVSVARQNNFSEGTPIPIPETEINREATFDPQAPTTPGSGTDVGVEGGTGTIISEGVSIGDEETAPNIFNPGIEKYPVIIYNPAPKYPDLARRAGVEGTVFIKMWVTKEGKVKQAEIVKSTSNLFDQAAMDAAIVWKFTPAIMNNRPVSVWVTVPFRFKLSL